MQETQQRIEEIKARLAAATPGEWGYIRENDRGWKGVSVYAEPGICIANMVGQLDDKETANAKFIAHAKADIEFLLTLVGVV